MSYVHEWVNKESIDDETWRRLQHAVTVMVADMHRIMARGPYRNGPETLMQSIHSWFWRRVNYPAISAFTCNRAYVGVTSGQADGIIDRFEFYPVPHAGVCKTNAHVYDRVVMGTLLWAEQNIPEFYITHTDADDEYADLVRKWLADLGV